MGEGDEGCPILLLFLNPEGHHQTIWYPMIAMRQGQLAAKLGACRCTIEIWKYLFVVKFEECPQNGVETCKPTAYLFLGHLEYEGFHQLCWNTKAFVLDVFFDDK